MLTLAIKLRIITAIGGMPSAQRRQRHSSSSLSRRCMSRSTKKDACADCSSAAACTTPLLLSSGSTCALPPAAVNEKGRTTEWHVQHLRSVALGAMMLNSWQPSLRTRRRQHTSRKIHLWKKARLQRLSCHTGLQSTQGGRLSRGHEIQGYLEEEPLLALQRGLAEEAVVSI